MKDLNEAEAAAVYNIVLQTEHSGFSRLVIGLDNWNFLLRPRATS